MASGIDWGYLRDALVRFAILLFIAAAAWGSTAYLGTRMAAEQAERMRTLEGMSDRDVQAGLSAKTLAVYRDRFRAYRAQGFVDGENRLGWLEQLQGASRELGLPSLRYTLAAQSAFRSTALPAGGDGVTASEMNLRVTLRHEGELMNLLHRLRDETHGLLWTRSCDLRRMMAPSEPMAKLEAECTLLWLTVDTTETGPQ
jgi:hypothetical protein